MHADMPSIPADGWIIKLTIIPASINLVSCHIRIPETQETLKNVEFSVCLSFFDTYNICVQCSKFIHYSFALKVWLVLSFILPWQGRVDWHTPGASKQIEINKNKLNWLV